MANIERRENRAVPNWLIEYKSVYQGFNLTQKQMESILGNTTHPGSIIDTYHSQQRVLFHQHVAAMADDLPQFIQYQSFQTRPHLNITVAGVSIGGTPATEALYYLPKKDAIYRVGPSLKKDPRFDPKSPEFIGFEQANAHYDALFIRLTHVDRQAWGNLDFYDIQIISEQIYTLLQDTPAQDKAEQLRIVMETLKKNTEIKTDEAEKQWAPAIKQRFINILNFYKRYPQFHRKLPTMIEGQFILGKDVNDRKRYYLNKNSEQLYIVPTREKKPLFGIKRTGEVAVFSNAEIAPENSWIDTAGYLAFTTKTILPLSREYYDYLSQ